MRFLITGGAGFVGSNLVDSLAREGNEVVVLDNLSRKGVEHNLSWLKERHKGIDFRKAPLSDTSALKDAVKGVDAIYHVAGQTAVTTSMDDPITDFGINAAGTLNVLEAARKFADGAALIFTSTNKVFGGMEDMKIAELDKRYEFKDYKNGVPGDRPIAPSTPYGCSKGAADSYVLDYAKTYGMKSVVFRMSCIYGTRQFGSVDQGWVVHFLISHVLSRPLTVYGDGKQVRDILYVDDLVNAFRLATKNIKTTKGKPYNIGGGAANTISLLELVEFIEKKYGKRFKLSFGEWRPSDQKVYYSDTTNAKKDFGWAPKVSTSEGLSKTYEWVGKNKTLFI